MIISIILSFVQAFGQNKFFSHLRQNNYAKKDGELSEVYKSYAIDMNDIHEEETIIKKKLEETTFESFKSFCESSLEQLFILKNKLGENYVKQLADIESRYPDKEKC